MFVYSNENKTLGGMTMNEKENQWIEVLKEFLIVIMMASLGSLIGQYFQGNETEKFKQKYEQQKEENNNLKKENDNLKGANSACRDYMLEEKLLIELQEENCVGNDDMLPVFHPIEETILNSQTMFGNLNDAVIATYPLVYCPNETKIKFHFKLTPPVISGDFMEGNLKPAKDWSFTCSLHGEDVKVEKDEKNPDYYYIILDEKGAYKFDQKFKDDFGNEGHFYFFIQW